MLWFDSMLNEGSGRKVGQLLLRFLFCYGVGRGGGAMAPFGPASKLHPFRFTCSPHLSGRLKSYHIYLGKVGESWDIPAYDPSCPLLDVYHHSTSKQ